MNSTVIGTVAFTCGFGGALSGVALRAVLPTHHLVADSKEAIKVGMGLVATIAAVLLGLLVASAKSSYDEQVSEITEMSAKIVLLDRVLAHYGPETKDTRDVVRVSATRLLHQGWPEGGAVASRLDPQSTDGEVVYNSIQRLSPKDDRQRSLQAQALSIALGLAATRWLMWEQENKSISMPLLIVLIFWLTALFISFGLFAPVNTTVIASFFVSALSVSGALVLIVEMYTPYSGLIKISSAPLRAAIAQLGM